MTPVGAGKGISTQFSTNPQGVSPGSKISPWILKGTLEHSKGSRLTLSSDQTHWIVLSRTQEDLGWGLRVTEYQKSTFGLKMPIFTRPRFLRFPTSIF